MPPSITTKVLEEIEAIRLQLATHFERDRVNCQHLDAMYKLLVTGNGDIPLPERVRLHEAWINEQRNAERDRRKSWLSISVLAVGEVISLVGMGIAVWLGLK